MQNRTQCKVWSKHQRNKFVSNTVSIRGLHIKFRVLLFLLLLISSSCVKTKCTPTSWQRNPYLFQAYPDINLKPYHTTMSSKCCDFQWRFIKRSKGGLILNASFVLGSWKLSTLLLSVIGEFFKVGLDCILTFFNKLLHDFFVTIYP